MPPFIACDMGTTRAVLNHGPNHWLLSRGGSWILGIPAVTEDCENQKTRAEIFLGLKGLEKNGYSVCACVDASKCVIFTCYVLTCNDMLPLTI